MSTGDATPGGTRVGAVPTSRIVRIAEAIGPLVAALAVFITVALAIPREAWLPQAPGPAMPSAWEQPLAWPLDWLATLQIACGKALWFADPVAGAILVAAVLGALTAAVLARSFRAAGLQPGLATLLALVAGSAPLASWHAASPLGAGPIALASAIALGLFVCRNRTAFPRPLSLALVGLALAIGIAADRAQTPLTLASLKLTTGDLGWPGLLLILIGFARGPRLAWPDLVLLTLVGVTALGTAMSGPAGAALALPWAWWLAARGAATLLSWRGAHASRWAAAGLALWCALNAGRMPWGHQRQQAALVRTWAEGLADVPTASEPLALEHSARGLLLTTLLRTRGAGASIEVATDMVRDAAARGRQPLVVGDPQRERLRWAGVAMSDLPREAGVSVERIVDALPRGTIVLAAISRSASAQFTPTQWQALGRVGLRLADAASARAHAVVGVTRTRVEGQEVAQANGVRLDVLPGDPIGRTGARSPVDARLEADETHARVWLRDRSFVDARGLVLLFFSTRGDLLGWRAGTSPAHLDGAPLGPAPSTTALALAPLPCVDIAPGRETDIVSLMREPALGITLLAAGDMTVALKRAEGLTAPASSLTGAAAEIFGADEKTFHVAADRPATFGIDLHGPALAAMATSSAAARVCAAWPPLTALDPAAARLDVPMSPDVERSLAGGWHGIEAGGNGRYFRWMSGRSAGVLLALKTPQRVHFALDAQGVATPKDGDVVGLLVNGHDAGTRPLLPTRGLYEWDIDAAWLRAGVNRLTLETTQTLRPTEHAAGADDRLLGLAVHGWVLTPVPDDSQPRAY